jgi:DNA polymerase I
MSGKQKRKLFLVDGTALAYRSHFAFVKRPLLNSRGQDVGAIFAYTGTLLRILRDEKPDLIAVAFDRPEPTFRHKRFEEYKATRDKTPDELIAQLPDIKAITEALGVRTVEKAGWEADDLIGTLARRGEEEALDVFIVAGDKDFMQLISETVVMYNLMRPDSDVTIQGIDAVREKFGVDPAGVVEVLGLMGDSSDNVPGVMGVGVKTAVNLIVEYGTIKNVYANLEKVKSPSLKQKLEKDREMAFLSRELVEIDTRAPVGVEPEGLEPGSQDTSFLMKKFIDFEFNSYIAAIEEEKEPEADERHYSIVEKEKESLALLARMRAARVFALDLETTSLNTLDAKIVGVSIALEEHEAFYIPAIVPGQLFPPEESVAQAFLGELGKMLADPEYLVIGQNIKYDLAVLEEAGITPIGARLFDTMVAHYLAHPGSLQHGLDFLALKYLGLRKIPTSALIGKGKKQITMAEVPVDQICEYACEDVDVTLRLKNILEKELDEADLRALFDDLEMPLLLVLMRMEKHGVNVDRSILGGLSADYGKRVGELTAEIYELAGEEFNLNSPRQLGTILFEKLEIQKELGLKRLRRTKTGYSTNAAVLESISGHPLGHLLLEYRRLQKLSSTYIEALPRLIHPRTRRVHTSFNQAVAATGRLSSSDPNLQNIPIRTPEGRRIREAFLPREEGWKILAADYSQVELRVLAHISGDENLIAAFRKGEDIHRDTAARIFGVPHDDVTGEMRSRAKTINFGIIYGMGPHRLSRETGISFNEAREFIAAYFDVFPGVRGYIDDTLEGARDLGYVSTLLGRKRRVDDILSGNQQLRANVENMAVNTPIQGTAADLIKKAMIAVEGAMKEEKLRSMMILQVHDELVFDVPEDEIDAIKRIVTEKMEGALVLDVPLVVDIGVAGNWCDAH